MEGKIKEIVIPKKMNYYFLECCFESDKKEIPTCERLGCWGKYKFDERSFEKKKVMLKNFIVWVEKV